MTATTYRSPAITAAAERARNGKEPFPTLSHRQSVKALRTMHESSRLRRGEPRVSLKLFAVCLGACVLLLAGLLAAYGAALWVVGQIALKWRGA